METEKLIDAANDLAEMYNNDDRENIKTDVMNAFYAGAKFGVTEEREACAAACESLALTTGIDLIAARGCAASIRMRSTVCEYCEGTGIDPESFRSPLELKCPACKRSNKD